MSVLFFQEEPFYNFSGGFYLFVDQTLLSYRTDTNFSSNPYLVLEHICIFQGLLIFYRTYTNFPGASVFSSNRYSFSRKPYLVLELILLSRRPLCLEQHFPETYPPSNRYFVYRSRWLLSNEG